MEFAIWFNDENIHRIRISKHWFIDSTFHRPKEFEQLLIIIYIDELSIEKIPGIFVLMNCKIQEIYENILMSICNIITQNNTLDFNVKTITSDSEDSLVNAIKFVFPKVNRVGCYFHYKMDIIRNLRIYNLYNIFNSDEIVNKLGKLPLIYKGNMKIFDEFINNLISENKPFINFINNYFLKNKRKYFLNEDYNYSKYICTVRSNSYIEYYNKYVKNELGNKKIVNWVTFIKFLKNELERTNKN